METRTDAMSYSGVAGNARSGTQLEAGKTYEFEVIGGTVRRDVVIVRADSPIPKAFRNRSKDPEDTGRGGPLTAAEIEAIDGIDLGVRKNGEKKTPYADVISIAVEEVDTGKKFFYDIGFIVYGGEFGADLLDFVRKTTGKIISAGDGVTIGEVLPIGTRFTARIENKPKKEGQFIIDVSSIGPSGTVALFQSLTENEKLLLGALKPYVGKSISEIGAYVLSGSFGSVLPTDAAVEALSGLEGTPYFEDGVLHL